MIPALAALSAIAWGMAAVNRKSEALQRLRSGFLIHIPVVGELVKQHYQSHFCKLMYLLYSSGVPLLQGVEMMRGILTFYPYRKSFEAIAGGLHHGESFACGMARFDRIYDRKLIALVKVGEETNTLSRMLRKQGEDLAVQLEYKLKQLGNMLEPLLILFVGILVAVVLVSMYMPMFKLGTTIY
ncbi:MAG: type II secretion system F family protein [Rikenellaceae bacterium]|nr:type II secretion system F family protein [Rikenellaceae bacterium]